MLGQALSLYRRHFAAFLLTCALALVPSDLLMAGAVKFGLASMGATPPRDLPAPDQIRNLKDEKLSPQDRTLRARQPGNPATDRPTALEDMLGSVLPLVYAAVVIVSLLVAGIAFAHAAMVPLVLALAAGQSCGPARAWAVVALRLRLLAWTWLLGLSLVALGSVFCLVPGLVLAAGFAFAVPATMRENLSGRAALERSWALVRLRWGRVLGVLILMAIFAAAGTGAALLVPRGPGRMFISALVRLLTFPFPLAALVLLYEDARAEETQYMRRSSAPG